MARPMLNEEQRLSRRTALLDAAGRLCRARGALPTVVDIAREAGMAKGAVYLWFRTKEEIFLALLDAGFRALVTRLLPVMEALETSPPRAARQFAAEYVKVIREMPDLLLLPSLGRGLLKNNLPAEPAVRFRKNLAMELSRAGELLERHVGFLEPGRGADVLLHTWTLTVGLWQVLDYPESVWKRLDDSALPILHRDFHVELEGAVARLWRGALSGDREESSEKTHSAEAEKELF
ncbi:MAG: TetR family transcriptional regulator [Syntrophobacteraceae bacterium]|nr:TetR family transcriptional regulator [Desulfobacteraceae bacterium]